MIRLLAPAKINLSLEILGRRPDGYHEIRSILAPISIFDRVEVTLSSQFEFWTDDPALDDDSNLAARAAASLGVPVSVRLWKRVPAAAGLGGASSDGAAVLRGVAALCPDLQTAAIDRAARSLGSDVPFFLGSGPAMARGRGDKCSPVLLAAPIWLVIAAPAIDIPTKTATLYRALTPSDFTDGARIDAVAKTLASNGPLETALLSNAFERALYAHWPEAAAVRDAMRAGGARLVALSGAGPAHYAVCENSSEAVHLASSIRRHVDAATRLLICRTLSGSTPIRRAGDVVFRTDGLNRT